MLISPYLKPDTFSTAAFPIACDSLDFDGLAVLRDNSVHVNPVHPRVVAFQPVPLEYPLLNPRAVVAWSPARLTHTSIISRSQSIGTLSSS